MERPLNFHTNVPNYLLIFQSLLASQLRFSLCFISFAQSLLDLNHAYGLSFDIIAAHACYQLIADFSLNLVIQLI